MNSFNSDCIKTLSEVKDGLDQSKKNHIDMIELILSANEGNLQIIEEKIMNTSEPINYIINIILFGFKIRPKQTKFFLLLLKFISKKFKTAKEYMSLRFSDYILNNKITDKHYNIINDFREDISTDIYEKDSIKGLITELMGYTPKPELQRLIDSYLGIQEEGSIEKAIQDDNIKLFNDIITNPSFDPNEKIETFSFFKGGKEKEKISYLQYIALHGSAKCFRTALINPDFDKDDINQYAIAGGNTEIIRILEQGGSSFDFCFEVATMFHRNNICDWLLANYRCFSCDLQDVISYFNDLVLFFHVENLVDFNSIVLDNAFLKAALNGNIFIAKYLKNSFYINLNYKNDKGYSSIHYAAFGDNIDIIKWLVEDNGIKADSVSLNGYDILFIGAYKGFLDVVKESVEEFKIPIDNFSDGCKTPLFFSLTRGFMKVTDYLISRNVNQLYTFDEYGKTILHKLVKKGDLVTLKMMIELYGADCKIVSKEGFNLLHQAAESNQTHMIPYLIDECHIRPSSLTSFNQTPLHIAAENGSLSSVQVLVLEYKANIECCDMHHRTPLFYAVINDNIRVVEFLIEVGASIIHTDYINMNPVHISCWTINRSTTILDFFINKCGVDPKKTDEQGNTLLYYAVQNENLNAVHYLVNVHHLPVNTVNKYGDTPILMANKVNNDIFEFLLLNY